MILKRGEGNQSEMKGGEEEKDVLLRGLSHDLKAPYQNGFHRIFGFRTCFN